MGSEARSASPWRFEIGRGPTKVTALELPERGSVVYLRWRENGNWRKESLGESCRTAGGKLIRSVLERAMAEARSRSLGRSAPPSDPAASSSSRLTISSASELVFHATTGRWSATTPHGREIARALAIAAAHWGASRPWAELSRADWRALWRLRLAALRAAGHRGFRGTELVIQRLATVADWLVEEGYVLRIQRPEAAWRDRLAEDYRLQAGHDPEAHRPRYTLEEMRALLAAAPAVDARFALLLALGAELRLGQVLRARRADLDLAAGTFVVRGRGKKRGTIVRLTAGQRAAVAAALAGYLQELEASGEDYPLFPSGQMPGGRKGRPIATLGRHLLAAPLNRRWVLAQLREAERIAGIAHLAGRGSYGMRRIAVDEALEAGISEAALQAHGGWTDSQIPNQIYRDRHRAIGAEEAARIRARIRGEFQAGTSDA